MKPETELRALRALGLMNGTNPRSQREVAEILGVGETLLSRQIRKLACRKELVRVTREWDLEVMKREYPHHFDHVVNWRPPSELEKKLNKRGHRVKVFEYPCRDGEDGLRDLANLAANDLAQLLRRSRRTGCAWGGALFEISRVLRPRAEDRVRFVPLCGDAARSQRLATYGSSAIATRLNERYRTPPEDFLSLASVPMMLPPATSEPMRGALHDVFTGLSKAFEDIYYGDSPLVDRLDTILTGVGAANHKSPIGYIDHGFYDGLPNLSPQELQDSVKGDISGTLVSRSDISDAARETIDVLNSNLTGLRIKHLKACADRARVSGDNGVIVLAVGGHKQDIIHHAVVELQLVNNLFLSRDLATALQDRL